MQVKMTNTVLPTELVQRMVNVLQEIPYKLSGAVLNDLRAVIEKQKMPEPDAKSPVLPLGAKVKKSDGK